MVKFGCKVACKYDRHVLCVRFEYGRACVRFLDDNGERRIYCKLLPEYERKRFMKMKSWELMF